MRIGRGMVTSVAPVSHTAWIEVIKDRVVGPNRATWSPGFTPCAWRRAAAARASTWSSAQEAVSWSSPERKVIVRPEYSATFSIRSMSDSTLL